MVAIFSIVIAITIHPVLAKNVISDHTIIGNAFNENKDYTIIKTSMILKTTNDSSKNDTISILNYNRGLNFFKMGNYIESLEAFDNALERAPRDDDCFLSSILSWKSTLLLNVLGRNNESLEVFDEVMTREPDSIDALNNKGLYLYSQKQYEAAIEVYDKALKVDPYYADALNNKGNALLALGKSTEALEYYQNATRIYKSGQSTDRLHEQYDESMLCESRDKPIGIVKLKPLEPLEISPSFNNTSALNDDYFNNTSIYYVTLDNKADIKELSSLINQGIALLNATKYPEADKIFDAVLVIDPSNAPALYNKYLVLEKQGNFKDALDFHKRATAEDPLYKGETLGLTETPPLPKSRESGILVLATKTMVAFFD